MVTVPAPDVEAVRAKIADEIPVWEEVFATGPGLVVGLFDAAFVAARLIAEARQEGREQERASAEAAMVALIEAMSSQFCGAENGGCTLPRDHVGPHQ